MVYIKGIVTITWHCKHHLAHNTNTNPPHQYVINTLSQPPALWVEFLFISNGPGVSGSSIVVATLGGRLRCWKLGLDAGWSPAQTGGNPQLVLIVMVMIATDLIF